MKEFDIVIIGGGPAGLTAAIYALRAGHSVAMVENFSVGGQVILTYEVANFPAFENITGYDLISKMSAQAEKLGLVICYGEISRFNFIGKIKTINIDGEDYTAKSVIIATGAKAKLLGISAEKKFIGRGVSYCATCDGAFFKNKTVAVIGGGNTAIEDALHLSGLASKVYLIHRRDEFRAKGVLVDKLKNNNNIEILYDSSVIDIIGEKTVEALSVKNNKTGSITQTAVEGLFVAIGRVPSSALFNGIVATDSDGYILANENMETNISGVFAAGDVIKKGLRQIITACADGAIAGENAAKYIGLMF